MCPKLFERERRVFLRRDILTDPQRSGHRRQSLHIGQLRRETTFWVRACPVELEAACSGEGHVRRARREDGDFELQGRHDSYTWARASGMRSIVGGLLSFKNYGHELKSDTRVETVGKRMEMLWRMLLYYARRVRMSEGMLSEPP